MIVDGRKIAEEKYKDILKKVSELSRSTRLTIFVCSPNFETRKYLELKKSKATAVGIELDIIEVDSGINTDELAESIREKASDTDGIIVQLPFPSHIDIDVITKNIPENSDVDALNPNTKRFLSPVVGSIKAILEEYDVDPAGKDVLVIGEGRLVGAPAFRWFSVQGANTKTVTASTDDISEYTKEADIIVCGAGVPGLLQPSMIKEDVVILDAGTSEDGGELKGDANPECAKKASLFTPVPGGIGPITIATLLQNVVDSVQ